MQISNLYGSQSLNKTHAYNFVIARNLIQISSWYQKCQFYHVIKMKQQRCGCPKTKYGNSNEFCSPPIFMWRKECHKIVSSSTYNTILLKMCWSIVVITDFEICPWNAYLINVEAPLFIYFTLLAIQKCCRSSSEISCLYQ